MTDERASKPSWIRYKGLGRAYGSYVVRGGCEAVMAYDVSVSENKRYIHIRVSGPVTADVLNDFISETAEKAREHKVYKYLFDLRNSPNRTSLFDHYEIVYKRAMELGFVLGSKHAMVLNTEDIPDYQFVETILNNAGFDARIFSDKKDAVEWLEE